MAAIDTQYLGEYYPREKVSAPRRALTGSLHFIRSKPLGAFGAFMLILIVVVGVFSPWIAPDDLNEAHF